MKQLHIFVVKHHRSEVLTQQDFRKWLLDPEIVLISKVSYEQRIQTDQLSVIRLTSNHNHLKYDIYIYIIYESYASIA